MGSEKSKILWLVTARAGSKGVPNKNIRELEGIPLLAIRILTAKTLGPVILSTDSEHYAEIGRKYGAEVPFIRPSELATDSASSIAVVSHALNFLSQSGRDFEYVGLLEPTSPFISSMQLKQALEVLTKTEGADHIVAVRETKPHPFFIQDDTLFLQNIAAKLKDLAHSGRQTFAKQITPSGGFYISRMEAFVKSQSFYTERTLAFLVDELAGIEIDTTTDLLWAEFLLQNSNVSLTKLWDGGTVSGA